MVVTSVEDQAEAAARADQNYNRTIELKAFDDTKAGVKGLVDAGVAKVPRMFFTPPEDISDKTTKPRETQFSIPIIDLDGVNGDQVRHTETVSQVRDAAEVWGFFQVVNHGIPIRVLEEMKDGVRRFYEQDTEEKKQWYTRDSSQRVVYNSNFDLYGAVAANWRDTTYCSIAPNPPKPEELPAACRDILLEYSGQLMKLGRALFELLSEALGLDPNHLNNMDCAEGLAILYHYYPACPEPELTLGATKHSDSDFLTVLLQDHIGGLQVLHQNQWIDVPPTPGALVVNVGDLMQASV
ncbi:unnamed protein product [Ilex paraguariensis]|uniref:Fe2OG dioxygenase domain-containing protein n=1 Tax=Ilex paraguariensis TaxID=185542 RepID=A0ABC8T7R8_9AQUA